MSDASKPGISSEEKNHSANPPGNPVLRDNARHEDKARQQEFAAEDETRASQTANINQHNLPIKQPNKQTNNS